MLAINDRVYWQGQKATVSQLWKKKARVITSELETITVAIEELTPYIEPSEGQIPLIDVSQFELKERAGFFDWEMDLSEVKEVSPEKSSITPSVIEPLPEVSPVKSSITPPVIELFTEVSPEKSSITPPVIEPLPEVSPEESSITPPVIEPLGFNAYTKHRKGKTYQYWRYSYRDGSRIRHIHIGNLDDYINLIGQPRAVVLAALSRHAKIPSSANRVL